MPLPYLVDNIVLLPYLVIILSAFAATQGSKHCFSVLLRRTSRLAAVVGIHCKFDVMVTLDTKVLLHLTSLIIGERSLHW